VLLAVSIASPWPFLTLIETLNFSTGYMLLFV